MTPVSQGFIHHVAGLSDGCEVVSNPALEFTLGPHTDSTKRPEQRLGSAYWSSGSKGSVRCPDDVTLRSATTMSRYGPEALSPGLAGFTVHLHAASRAKSRAKAPDKSERA